MEEITLFYATNNKSKLHNMRYRLRKFPIRVVCPDNIHLHIDVEENGVSAVENAVLKAKAYSREIPWPVVAGDSGMTISGIKSNDQPGLYVRRVKGKILSDDEMIEYYSRLAKSAQGECYIHYYTGLALITKEGLYTMELKDKPMILSATPNTNRYHRGNPLDVISQLEDGRYFNDLSDEERTALDAVNEKKFTDFIINHLPASTY